MPTELRTEQRHFGPSSLAFALADSAPGLTKGLLEVWARRYIGKSADTQHWLFRELRGRLKHQIVRSCVLPTSHQIYVDAFDAVGAEILVSGWYEPELVRVLQSLIHPGMTCVDVGANIGQHTIVAASCGGPTGRVYAFEPTPSTYALLERNVATNRLSNVSCYRLAVSDRRGSASLHLAGEAICANSLAPTAHSSGERIDIETVTLDEFVIDHRVPRIDFIKADVEGAELLVLRGAKRVIDTSRPIVVLEFSRHMQSFGYSPREIASELQSAGYTLFRIGQSLEPWTDDGGSDLYYNVLAAPRERLHEWESLRLGA